MPKLGTATSWILVTFLLSHQGRSTLWQITRLLGSAADVSQSTSRMAGASLDEGANVTSAVASMAVAAASSTLSLSNEVGLGVDLRNNTLAMAEGTVAGDTAGVVQE